MSTAYTARGKPVIKTPAGAGMSVSYCGELGLLVVNGAGDVGADMEVVRDDLDFLGMARACFAPEEVRALEASRRRRENFFALWTAKEAVLKLLGEGIAGGMAWPCLAGLELGGRAVVDGMEVVVSRCRLEGRDIVTAVAYNLFG